MLQIDEDKFPSLPGGPPSTPAPGPPSSPVPVSSQQDINQPSTSTAPANPQQLSTSTLWGQAHHDMGQIPSETVAGNPSQSQFGWDQPSLEQNGWGAPSQMQTGWEPNPSDSHANSHIHGQNGQQNLTQGNSWAQHDQTQQGIWTEPQQGSWEQLVDWRQPVQDQGPWNNPSQQDDPQGHPQVLNQGGWDLPKQEAGLEWQGLFGQGPGSTGQGSRQTEWEPNHTADSHR